MDLVDIDECENFVMKFTDKSSVKPYKKPDFDMKSFLAFCEMDNKVLWFGQIILDYLYMEQDYYENLNVSYDMSLIDYLEDKIETIKKEKGTQFVNDYVNKYKQYLKQFKASNDDDDEQYRKEKKEQKNKRRLEIQKIKELIDKDDDNINIDIISFEDLDIDELKMKEPQYVVNTIKKYKNMYKFLDETEKSYKAFLFCNSDKHTLEFKYLHHTPEIQQQFRDCFYCNADERNIPYKLTAYKLKKVLKPLLDEAEKFYDEKKNEANDKHKAYIAEHNAKKTICECGAEVSAGNMSKHRQTKRHLDYVSKHN